METKTYAVIGAGNGGQAMAAYLSMKGQNVKIFDFFNEQIEKIKKKGYIELTGAVEGKGIIDIASNNIEEVISGADVIMIVNPAIYHKKIAEACAPFLEENQIVFLNPGATFGSFAFKKALEDCGCHKKITIAESNTLIFACRAVEAGKVQVGGKKDRIMVSTLPACDNQKFYDIISSSIEEAEMFESVIAVSLDNTNPFVHPFPTVMNASWIESGNKFRHYIEGIGPSVGHYIEKMDAERIAIGEKFGLILGENMFSLLQQYVIEYNVKKDTLSEVLHSVDAYAEIYAASDIKTTRYIYEDIPMALVPLVEMGKQLGVSVKNMELVIDLCEGMLDEDFYESENNRSLENLGLRGMTCDEILEYAKTGEKPSLSLNL